MSDPLINPPLTEEPIEAKAWARKHVRGRGGKEASDRQIQLFLKATRPPIFTFGHTKLIFPSRGNAHLARLAEEQNQPPRRGPGRPRAVG